MHKRHKYDIIVVLSLIGFGVSVYLATAHYLGFTVPCSITRGCEGVLESKYASLLGLPLAVWGTAFYAGLIVSALLANHYRAFRKLLTAVAVLGTAFAAYFLVLQFFVIRQVCQYCLLTDLLAIIIFLWDLNIEHRRPEALAANLPRPSSGK